MPRYALGDNFAFKTKLTLYPGGKSTESKGKDWSVTPVNLSATGASVQLSMAAVAFFRAKPASLKFSHAEYLLEIPATIAHFRCCSQYSLCGIVFNSPTPASYSKPTLSTALNRLLSATRWLRSTLSGTPRAPDLWSNSSKRGSPAAHRCGATNRKVEIVQALISGCSSTG